MRPSIRLHFIVVVPAYSHWKADPDGNDKWYEPVEKCNISELKAYFEAHFLKRIKAEETRLANIERIQMLLKMMNYQIEVTDLSKKQFIENIREFTRREVLPTPLGLDVSIY